MTSPAMYRKKPITIQAMQFVGSEDSAKQVADWMTEQGAPGISNFAGQGDDSQAPVLMIETLEGTMKANAGDWIIRGVKGEFYPCKPEIFEATYEAA